MLWICWQNKKELKEKPGKKQCWNTSSRDQVSMRAALWHSEIESRCLSLVVGKGFSCFWDSQWFMGTTTVEPSEDKERDLTVPRLAC